MSYNTCPKCGANKKRAAELCRSCRKSETISELHKELDNPNPSGLCQCGCGGKTSVSSQTNRARGTVRGFPRRYLRGHQNILSPVPYLVNMETGCWEWQRGMLKAGYGKLNRDGKTFGAHVIFYERHVGPVPEGKVLDHTCHNRKCVNPSHLEPVTHVENCRRGLGTKLTANDVNQIRELAASVPQKELASRFGVRQGHISRIVNGRRWRVDTEPPSAISTA